jgi:hypothetical protein
VPFLSYGGEKVDSGSFVRGHAVGLSLGAILMVELHVVDAVVWSIVVVLVCQSLWI